jgi:hypothetical protein
VAVDRLKTRIWVQAQIRLCDIANLPAYIVKRGDPDAGAVILRLNRLDGTSNVFNQARLADGSAAWSKATGSDAEGRIADADAVAYIERQRKYDPDLWVLEIEDPERRYTLDAKIV